MKMCCFKVNYNKRICISTYFSINNSSNGIRTKMNSKKNSLQTTCATVLSQPRKRPDTKVRKKKAGSDIRKHHLRSQTFTM